MTDRFTYRTARRMAVVAAMVVAVASLPPVAGAPAAGATAAPAGVTPASDAQPPCQWTSFGRTPAGTSFVPNVSGPTDLATDWTESFAGDAVSGVSAADGRLYGAADEVFALDPATGATLWTFPNNDPNILPRPVVAGDRVYLVPDGELVALDADTGTEAWRISHPGGGFVPTPVDSVAYLPVGDTLRAYDAADGDRLWRANLSGTVTATAVLADGAVYVPDDSGRLTAVDADDGTILPGRSATVGGSDASRLVATDRSVLVLNATGIRAVALDDGSVRWANESIDPAGTPSIAADATSDTAYVAVASGMIALDTTSGDVRWRQTGIAEPTAFTVSATTDAVVVGAGSSVIVLDAADGSIRAQEGTAGTVQTAHVVGPRVYADFGTTIRAYGGPTDALVGTPITGTSPPRDGNCDGLYEDVTGDGNFNVLDVSVFLQAFGGTVVGENAAAFDFNGDGTINILDVAALLDET